MKIYTDMDVLTAAKKRIRFAYESEPNVMISVSGGKDSTVALELSIEVAREMGRLPVIASFLDQESEYQGTVDYMRYLWSRKEEIKLYWWQVPFVLTNSTARNEGSYLHCWREGEKWVRDKEPYTIHENPVSEVRFHKLYPLLHDHIWNQQFYLDFNGIRANESQIRTILMYKVHPMYKNCRWCSTQSKGIKMYPIYDWTVNDVWKAIYEHGWKYNSIYDLMYQRGVKRTFMRVSSIIHETGHWALQGLHEMEPATYDALAERIEGVETYHSGGDDLYIPDKLPLAFSSWVEYRDYLIDNLIEVEEHRQMFRHRFAKQKGEEWAREHVGEVILNDYEGTKNRNARLSRSTTTFFIPQPGK